MGFISELEKVSEDNEESRAGAIGKGSLKGGVGGVVGGGVAVPAAFAGARKLRRKIMEAGHKVHAKMPRGLDKDQLREALSQMGRSQAHMDATPLKRVALRGGIELGLLGAGAGAAYGALRRLKKRKGENEQQ